MLSASVPLKFEDLSYDASGACKAEFDITVNNLDVDISGAGTIILKGKVEKVKLDISGAGKFMAALLGANEYGIDISETGSAEVNAISTLDVSVSGTGNVKYFFF